MSIQSGNYYFNQFTKNIFLRECNKDYYKVEASATDSVVIQTAFLCIGNVFTIENESIFLAGQRLKERVMDLHTEGKIPKPVVEYILTLLGRYISLHAMRLQEVTCAILESVPPNYPNKDEVYKNLNKAKKTCGTDESYSELCLKVWDNFYENPDEHKLISRNRIFDSVRLSYFGRWGHTFNTEFKDEIPSKIDRIFFSVPKEVMYSSLSYYQLNPKVTMRLVDDPLFSVIETLKYHSPREIARYKLVCKLWNDSLREKNHSKMLAQSLFKCLNNVVFYHEFSYPLTNLVLCLEQYGITNSLDTPITLEQCDVFEKKFSPFEQGKSQSSGRWLTFYGSNRPPQSIRAIFETAQYDFAMLTKNGEKNIQYALMRNMKFTETSKMEEGDRGYWNSRDQFLELVKVLEEVSKFLDSILGPYVPTSIDFFENF